MRGEDRHHWCARALRLPFQTARVFQTVVFHQGDQARDFAMRTVFGDLMSTTR